MVLGEAADPHQGRRHRGLDPLCEPEELPVAVGVLDAASDVDDGPLRLHQGFRRLPDLEVVDLQVRAVARKVDLRILELHLVGGDVPG